MKNTENNILLANFDGIEGKENVADWSDYDHVGITDAIDLYCGTIIKLDSPKGSGKEWFTVKHRNSFKTIFSDGTWCKKKKEDVKLFYDGFLIEDLKYDGSYKLLMPIIEKILNLGYSIEVNFDYLVEIKKGKTVILCTELKSSLLEAYYEAAVKFVKFYNREKEINNLISKKEFKELSSIHIYGKGESKRVCLYFDWLENDLGRGYKYMVKGYGCTQAQILKDAYEILIKENTSELCWYDMKVAKNDSERFKVALLG